VIPSLFMLKKSTVSFTIDLHLNHHRSELSSVVDSDTSIFIEKMTSSDTAQKKKRDLAQKLLDDCDRPSCDDMVGMMKQAMNRSKEKEKVECPPTSPELGRSTWTLLHTLVCRVLYE
jgi:hypothetical protein